LVGGQQDPEKLADLAEGRLRAKIPDLKLALEGHFSEHHKFLVEHLLRHLDDLETIRKRSGCSCGQMVCSA